MINFSGLSNAMDRAKSAIGRGEARDISLYLRLPWP